MKFLRKIIVGLCFISLPYGDQYSTKDYLKFFNEFEDEPNEYDSDFYSILAELMSKNIFVKSMNSMTKAYKQNHKSGAIEAFLPTISIGFEGDSSYSDPYIQFDYGIYKKISEVYKYKRSKYELDKFRYGEFPEKILSLTTDLIKCISEINMSTKCLHLLNYFIKFYEKLCSDLQISESLYVHKKSDLLKAKSSLAQMRVMKCKYESMKILAEDKFRFIMGRDYKGTIKIEIDENISISDVRKMAFESFLMKKLVYEMMENIYSYKAEKFSKIGPKITIRGNIGSDMRMDTKFGVSIDLISSDLLKFNSLSNMEKSEKIKFKYLKANVLNEIDQIYMGVNLYGDGVKSAKAYKYTCKELLKQQMIIFSLGNLPLSDLLKSPEDYINSIENYFDSIQKHDIEKAKLLIILYGDRIFQKNFKVVKAKIFKKSTELNDNSVQILSKNKNNKVIKDQKFTKNLNKKNETSVQKAQKNDNIKNDKNSTKKKKANLFSNKDIKKIMKKV